MTAAAAPDNIAIYVAALALLSNVVGYFIMAWKSDKDKIDEKITSDIAELSKAIARIEVTLAEREKKYNENFKRLEDAITSKRR